MQVIYISYTSETNNKQPAKKNPNKQTINKTNQPKKPQTNNKKKRNDTITFGK